MDVDNSTPIFNKDKSTEETKNAEVTVKTVPLSVNYKDDSLPKTGDKIFWTFYPLEFYYLA